MGASGQPDLIIRNFNGEMSPVDFKNELAPLKKLLASTTSPEVMPQKRHGFGGFRLFGESSASDAAASASAAIKPKAPK